MNNTIETKKPHLIIRIILIVAAWLAVLGNAFANSFSFLAPIISSFLYGYSTLSVSDIIDSMIRSTPDVVYFAAFVIFALFITLYCLKMKGKVLFAIFFGVLALSSFFALMNSMSSILSIIGMNVETYFQIIVSIMFDMAMNTLLFFAALFAMINVLKDQNSKLFPIITAGIGIFYTGVLALSGVASIISTLTGAFLDFGSTGTAVSIILSSSSLICNSSLMFLFVIVLISAIVIKFPSKEIPAKISEEPSTEETPAANE